MRPRKPLPTQARLQELFNYHEDGYLVRRIWVSGTFIGQELRATSSHRYRSVMVDGVSYYLHRLIYAWHHGNAPDLVDHEDRQIENCRIGNLRPATPAESTLNTCIRSDNTSGVRGVYLQGSRFCVRPNRGGSYHWVGSFATMDEARAAFDAFNMKEA